MDIVIGTLALRPYVIVFLASYLVLGARDLGWRSTLVFGGWVWCVAWVSEFSSTRTGVPFGLYTYTGATRGQELFIADVPFMDALSFTFLAYAAFCLARGCLGRTASPLALTVLGGAFMMLLDVVIDPLAVRGERWFLGHIFWYAESGIYFGVPLSNFAGWLFVGAVGVGGYLLMERLMRPSGVSGDRPGLGIGLYYGVLGFNLVMTGWIGEWSLLLAGSTLHIVLGIVLYRLSRAGGTWSSVARPDTLGGRRGSPSEA